jgi:hypothetical protein
MQMVTFFVEIFIFFLKEKVHLSNNQQNIFHSLFPKSRLINLFFDTFSTTDPEFPVRMLSHNHPGYRKLFRFRDRCSVRGLPSTTVRFLYFCKNTNYDAIDQNK